MGCDLWGAKIDAYVDAELSPEEMRAFGEHLRACPSCAADTLSRVQWKRSIQLAGRRFAPRIEFRQRIERQTAAPRKRAWSAVWLPRLAVTAIVVVAAFMVGREWLSFQQGNPFGELADLHVATLASSSPVDVVSSDRHAVKPWFEGKIPFTFNLPDLENAPFTLLGGRVTYLDQRPGAQLLFQIHKHKISAFIFQDSSAWIRRMSAQDLLSKQLSFTVETWSQGGLRYFVIGDMSPDDIHRLSELMKNAARP